MAYKFSMLLSLVFLVFAFMLAGDITIVSSIRSELDNLALTVSYRLARDGYLSADALTLIEDFGARLVAIDDDQPAFGQTVRFILGKDYEPLLISKDTMTITVKGAAIVGYIV